MAPPVHTWALDATWRSLLRDLGASPANVLRRAGLAEDLLNQPSVRLGSEDYYSLWNGIEAELGDQHLALRVCEAARSESFSPLLFAALCSPNLLVAAERIAQYKRLVAPLRFELQTTLDTLTIDLRWLEESLTPPASLAAMELLFPVALARIGTRERIVPIGITMPRPPQPANAYDSFLGVRVRPGDALRVTFSRTDAVKPFLTSNEIMWTVFEPDLRQRLAELEGSVTTSKRVRAALLEGLPSGQISMEAIGGRLALSKRTLQRRIETEGTSYQQILKDTREELARHYLARTNLAVPEIAFLLGFEEPNSFYRAFRTWTGQTPDKLRRTAGTSLTH